MKIKDILRKMQIEDLFGTAIQIIKISAQVSGRGCSDEKQLEGKTGVLTNPFSSFDVEGLGVFLDTGNPDCCNLALEDEIKLLK